MSTEIDKIRDSERKRQLMLLPVAFIFTCLSVALYVFHAREGTNISGFHLWGISKYIWLTSSIIFAGLAICGTFSMLSKFIIWFRMREVPNLKLKIKIAASQVAKCLILVFSSLYFLNFFNGLILKNVSIINRKLLVDSFFVEFISFFGWFMVTIFIVSSFCFYVVFSIKAPFDFIKGNRIFVDYSANDGGPT